MQFVGKINRQICSQNWHEFHGNEKLGQLCFARQDSRNNHTMLQTSQEHEKTRFLKFICSDFWTDLNGCQQRLLFAHQLTKRKWSLCWQLFNSDLLCYPKLPLVPLITPCYPMLPLVNLVNPCYPLLPLLTIVTPCYTCYPLLPLVTPCYPCYHMLPLLPLVTPCYPWYPMLPLVTPCYLCYPLLPMLPLLTPCYPCYPFLPHVTPS